MRTLLRDKAINALDNGIKTILTPAVASRPTPAANCPDNSLTVEQQRESARLMRVNHCGEVCAQALYQGQALFAKDEAVVAQLAESAREEIDHLAWTATRIHELGGRQSFLNPLWYGGSFLLGATAALISDRVSLGFVAETEKQVSIHLSEQLRKLPAEDEKSNAVVRQMDIDERQHATQALAMGGMELPTPVKGVMHLLGRVMTRTSYWL